MQKSSIKIDNDWKQNNGNYKCPECKKELTKKGICSHIWRLHTKEGKESNLGFKQGYIPWNKNLMVWRKEDLEKRMIF